MTRSEAVTLLREAETRLSLACIPDLVPEALECEAHLGAALMAIREVRRSIEFPDQCDHDAQNVDSKGVEK